MTEPRIFTVFVSAERTQSDNGYAPPTERLADYWAAALAESGGTPVEGADLGVEWVSAIGSRSAGWTLWGQAYPPLEYHWDGTPTTRPTSEQAAAHTQATNHEILISAEGVERCTACVWPSRPESAPADPQS